MYYAYSGSVEGLKKFLADLLVKEASLQSHIALAKWSKK